MYRLPKHALNDTFYLLETLNAVLTYYGSEVRDWIPIHFLCINYENVKYFK